MDVAAFCGDTTLKIIYGNYKLANFKTKLSVLDELKFQALGNVMVIFKILL